MSDRKPTIDEDLGTLHEALRGRPTYPGRWDALTRIRAALAELRYHRANAEMCKDMLDEREHLETAARLLRDGNFEKLWDKGLYTWLEAERARLAREGV